MATLAVTLDEYRAALRQVEKERQQVTTVRCFAHSPAGCVTARSPQWTTTTASARRMVDGFAAHWVGQQVTVRQGDRTMTLEEYRAQYESRR